MFQVTSVRMNSDSQLNAKQAVGIFQLAEVVVRIFQVTSVRILRLKIPTDQFCTIKSDQQLNVIYAVGIFRLASVAFKIFQVASVRILVLRVPTGPFCKINSDWQLNVIYAVGIFQLTSVVVGIFKVTTQSRYTFLSSMPWHPKDSRSQVLTCFSPYMSNFVPSRIYRKTVPKKTRLIVILFEICYHGLSLDAEGFPASARMFHLNLIKCAPPTLRVSISGNYS